MQVQLQNLWIFIKTENSIAQLQQEKRNPSSLLCHKHGDIKFSRDEYTGNNFSCRNPLTGEICYLLQATFQAWKEERCEVRAWGVGQKKFACSWLSTSGFSSVTWWSACPNPLWQDESQCCLSFEEDVMRKQDTKHQNNSAFCKCSWGVTLNSKKKFTCQVKKVSIVFIQTLQAIAGNLNSVWRPEELA